MLTPIQVSNIEGKTTGFNVIGIPEVCPICHISIEAKLIVQHQRNTESKSFCEIVFQCPRNSCKSFYIGYYEISHEATGSGPTSTYFSLVRVAPKTPAKLAFSEIIQTISPNFIEICNQANVADSMELTEVSGIGLRKALEFLIKDFAISQNPGLEDTIRKKPIAQCIKDHVDDPNVKECARRAVWLGNDETHYTRKWSNKDVTDLKILIKLTNNWIETVVLTKKYMDDMKE